MGDFDDGMHMLSNISYDSNGMIPTWGHLPQVPRASLPGIGGHLGRCTAECAPMQVGNFGDQILRSQILEESIEMEKMNHGRFCIENF